MSRVPTTSYNLEQLSYNYLLVTGDLLVLSATWHVTVICNIHLWVILSSYCYVWYYQTSNSWKCVCAYVCVHMCVWLGSFVNTSSGEGIVTLYAARNPFLLNKICLNQCDRGNIEISAWKCIKMQIHTFTRWKACESFEMWWFLSFISKDGRLVFTLNTKTITKQIQVLGKNSFFRDGRLVSTLSVHSL